MDAVNGFVEGRGPIRVASGDFYGATVHHRQLDGMTLAAHRYGPSQSIPWHAHESAYVSFCLRGSYSEVSRGRTLDCGRATALFHPAGESHRDRFHATGGLVFMLEIAPNWIERISDYQAARTAASRVPSSLTSPGVFVGGPMVHLGARLYDSFLDEGPTSRLTCEGIALEILGALARPRASERSPRSPRWLHRVTDYLRASFMDHVMLSEVAALAGVHPVHCAREFRRYHQTSVGAYVRRLRVEFACRELALSSKTIAQIALDAGFADQSHMTNTFRRMLSTSPSAYRRAFRRA